jgi:hypothetical protein
LSSLSAADKAPGFTGKFREELLGAAPGIELQARDINEAADGVSSQVKGHSTYTYDKEVMVPAYTAMLYSAEYEMPPGIGMYHLTGLVTGPAVLANRAHSKLYIYDFL